jgi:hypothetical protein
MRSVADLGVRQNAASGSKEKETVLSRSKTMSSDHDEERDSDTSDSVRESTHSSVSPARTSTSIKELLSARQILDSDERVQQVLYSDVWTISPQITGRLDLGFYIIG